MTEALVIQFSKGYEYVKTYIQGCISGHRGDTCSDRNAPTAENAGPARDANEIGSR